jgi:uncharacterized membrane protein
MENNGNQTPFSKYSGRIAITAVLFLFALLWVTVGIFKAVFVAAVTALGFYIGAMLDDRDALRRFLDNFLGRH